MIIRHAKLRNKGFVALISVLLISAFLMAMVLQNTIGTAALFDEADREQQRLSAVQAALACLDRSVLELTHDYFFQVSYVSASCSIVSISETAGGTAGDGHETITVYGISKNVKATIIANILLSDQKISLLSQKTFF